MENYIGRCSCIHCKVIYSARGIYCHVDRSHLGKTQYSNGYNGKYDVIKDRAKAKKEKERNEYLKNPLFCSCCGKIVPFEKRKNKSQACSKSCSAILSNKKRNDSGWSLSMEQRRKASESLTGKEYIKPYEENVVCPCGNEFIRLVISNKRKKNYCSKSCAVKYSPSCIKRKIKIRKQRTSLSNYRLDCAFRFALNDYPDEFEFSLIEQFGWYRAKNRGDNLNGVSRDHMISIMYGFDNNIDPKIISHPANCKLLRHSDNVSKGKKNSITLEELLKRIEVWDKKYSKVGFEGGV